MTKKEKIERFDSVNAERGRLSLAMYDLVNGKFSAPVKVWQRDFDMAAMDSKDASHKDWIEVRLSFRAMPLFLIKTNTGHTEVMDETQIRDAYQEHKWQPWANMLQSAMTRLFEMQHLDEVARLA